MVFVVCGLNHKTAPIEIREQVVLPVGLHNTWLQNLLDLPEVHEGLILSTCNRTEIYCYTQNPQLLPLWLAKEQGFDSKVLAPFLYLYEEEQAVKHLLRVASSLDSMVIGESQILGQMKQAYHQACHFGAVQSQLRPIFESAFSASKRIRSQSGIGINSVSIASVAVQLIEQSFSSLKQLQVLLIGSGETATLVAKYLQQQGVQNFMIASRTVEHAEQLANHFKGKCFAITELSEYLPDADVVISATSCPLPFIHKGLVEQALQRRNKKPMFFMDLAVPRDIESKVKELEAVQLYNVDDLYLLTEKGMSERRQAALQAEQLIEIELDNYLRRHRSLKVKSVICTYRTQMQLLAEEELQRAFRKLKAGATQQSVLNEFSERLVNKLTHHSTTGLREIARDGREDVLTLAQYLFNPNTCQPTYEEIT